MTTASARQPGQHQRDEAASASFTFCYAVVSRMWYGALTIAGHMPLYPLMRASGERSISGKADG